jgi:hypothetical protein
MKERYIHKLSSSILSLTSLNSHLHLRDFIVHSNQAISVKLAFHFMVIFCLFTGVGIAQVPGREFDSVHFDELVNLANQLIECEFHTELAITKLSPMEDVSYTGWISYKADNVWHAIGGISTGSAINFTKHLVFDSINQMSEYSGFPDSAHLKPWGCALAHANTEFQLVRDTSKLYFNAFVHPNENQTISVWFLPAFQPSGQALYGCEWEYIFDKTGTMLIKQNSFTNKLTGVWIGQPRELWLNYRNTDNPTLGSVFFALAFRDYFTRIRIDTRFSISTTAKDASGNYTWIHKMK